MLQINVANEILQAREKNI